MTAGVNIVTAGVKPFCGSDLEGLNIVDTVTITSLHRGGAAVNPETMILLPSILSLVYNRKALVQRTGRD